MIAPKPMLDPWRDALLLELRMREITGDRIGEILAEVDAHCADSGEDPQEAFGDPSVYARSFEPVDAPPTTRTLRAGVQAFATVAGILAVLSGVDAVSHGIPGTVTAGNLVAVAVVTAVTVVFCSLPAMRRRPALVVLLVVGVLGSMAPQVLWQETAFRLPGWALLAGGFAMLVLGWGPWLNGRIAPDPVIDPRTGRDAFPVPRFFVPLVFWGLPLMLVAAGALIIALP